ncbi:MAG TPA: phosphate acyltransferase, partial [Candidatus Acidoferrum sp.]
LTSANTCCRLLSRIGGAETIGPILMGMSKPVHVLHRDAEVEEIVNIAAIAVVDAQDTEARRCADGNAGREMLTEEKPEAEIETVKR